METFATRLEALREALGINQSELGRRLGVSPQAVQKWESGANGPRGERLNKLASTHRTTVGYLISGEGKSCPFYQSDAADAHHHVDHAERRITKAK